MSQGGFARAGPARHLDARRSPDRHAGSVAGITWARGRFESQTRRSGREETDLSGSTCASAQFGGTPLFRPSRFPYSGDSVGTGADARLRRSLSVHGRRNEGR
ncbi:hypothetical protein NSERUTF1_7528 [Nocardia seriolae]|nr:hypothetical protein NSERUTF1_7528 [Nocardia seriolae]